MLTFIVGVAVGYYFRARIDVALGKVKPIIDKLKASYQKFPPSNGPF